MRSREEIRVRASCYDNEQNANSKYTYTWDHLLCQKATLFRELGINSIVPSIWRCCLAFSRAVLFTYLDEWRRNSGLTMAFYITCSCMLVTCLERSCSIPKCYLRVLSDDLRVGLVQRGLRGVAVGWGTALQAGRSRVRFPIVSLEFFIDIILSAALWPWGRLSV